MAVQSINADRGIVATALKAKEQEELESRLEELEAAMERREGGHRYGA